MGIGNREQWWVVCDEPGCFRSSDESNGDIAENEGQAIRDAKESGYVQVGGKWFCEEHNPNKDKEE